MIVLLDNTLDAITKKDKISYEAQKVIIEWQKKMLVKIELLEKQ